ncbi:hypothetical protein AMTRI_Chr02g215560 [Amborella trichopoda]
MKVFFALNSRCKKEAILFWGPGLAGKYWKKIEEVKKQILLEKFKVKQYTQYDIMLVEAELMPQEVEAICPFVTFAQHLTTSMIDKISKEAIHATQNKVFISRSMEVFLINPPARLSNFYVYDFLS